MRRDVMNDAQSLSLREGEGEGEGEGERGRDWVERKFIKFLLPMSKTIKF